MATKEIHGHSVHYDEGSESIKYAIEYLGELDRSEAEVFFDMAANKGYSRFETPHHTGSSNKSLEHDMTLEHRGDSYYLRKRSRS